jgi:hypothetical protein
MPETCFWALRYAVARTGRGLDGLATKWQVVLMSARKISRRHFALTGQGVWGLACRCCIYEGY